MKLFAVLFGLVTLSACSTVVDTGIPIDPVFESKAEKLVLKAPGFFVTDKAYNIQLAEYKINGTKVSPQESRSKLIDVRSQHASLIEYILFDEDYSFIEKDYEVSGFQKFSFSLNLYGESKAQSQCQRFTQSERNVRISDRHHSHDFPARENYNINERLQTYFVCKILQDKQVVKFSLESQADGYLALSLSGTSKPYQISTMTDQFLLVKNKDGVERREIPPWAKSTSGIVISLEGEKLAVVSTVGHTKIWLNKNMASESRELLLTLAYSLSMFNWLDDDWNIPAS